MAKKRKQVEAAEEPKEEEEEVDTPRPRRTLLGSRMVRSSEEERQPRVQEQGEDPGHVLETDHLLDNKVESKGSKGATLNELVELRNCSHCLFFEKGELYASLDGQVT